MRHAGHWHRACTLHSGKVQEFCLKLKKFNLTAVRVAPIPRPFTKEAPPGGVRSRGLCLMTMTRENKGEVSREVGGIGEGREGDSYPPKLTL